MLGHVRAPAVVEVAGDRVVVVAVDRRDRAGLDHAAHLVRVRAIADEVSAAEQPVDADRVDRREAGLERRQVAVDVGYHRDALQLLPPVGRCRSSRFDARHERFDQLPHVVVELVANPSDDLQRLAGGIGDRPVLVSLARVHRAHVPAAQRDDDVGGADDGVGERLGELRAHVEADLRHRLARPPGRSARRDAIRPTGPRSSPATVRGRDRPPSGCARRCARTRTAPRAAASRPRPLTCAIAHSCSRANRSMITGKKFGPTVGRSPMCCVGGLDVAPDRLGREHAVEFVRRAAPPWCRGSSAAGASVRWARRSSGYERGVYRLTTVSSIDTSR